MPRRTFFSKQWLAPDANANNGECLSDWCTDVKLDSNAAHCKVCYKTFSIANMGLRQILSHAEAEKHKSNMNNLKGQSVFRAVRPVPVSMPTSPCVASHEECPATQSASTTAADVVLVCPQTQCGKSWVPVSLDDKVKKAEILSALKLVHSNYSFNSYSDIADVCKSAFVDSDIAKHMQLGSTKVSYLIVHGLVPYFRNYFMRDMKSGIGYFTIYFDETITRQVKKQMDMYIAYWSLSFKKVVSLFVEGGTNDVKSRK